jgi:putative cardiolipin synthase
MGAVQDKLTEPELEAMRQYIDESIGDRDDEAYRQAFSSELLEGLISGETTLFSANGTVVTDEPDKLVQPVSQETTVLLNHLDDEVQTATSEVLILTPYLIPGKKGVTFWQSIVEKGVRVVILTNSLASNHHTFVHSSYARYRKDLLRAGVELYEVRANTVPRESEAESVSLHIKGMIIDRNRAFIGSPNFDPRSFEINSEMGIIIDSADMSSQLAEGVMQRLPELTYRVELNAKGRLRWHGTIDGVEVIETSEPLASLWLRFKAWIFRIAPDRQL